LVRQLCIVVVVESITFLATCISLHFIVETWTFTVILKVCSLIVHIVYESDLG